MAIPANPTETLVLDWLATRTTAMESLLGDLVRIDSNSFDPEGVQAVARRLETFLLGEGVALDRTASGSGADILTAKVASFGDLKPALLMGHMDTVFPAGTVAVRSFAVDGDRLHGPGVADMKAGLVIVAFVLAALSKAGDIGRPVHALFTIDEEIASPLSRSHIVEAASRAAFVLNAEPGRANGNVVVERKGGVFGWLSVTGKEAHAGVDFPSGSSAITELAHKIVALEALTDLKAGITVNVGLVEGGRSINTVAPTARAGIDIRYVRPEQRADLVRRLTEIAVTAHDPQTSAVFTIGGEFDPMVPSANSRILFDLYRTAAQTIGFAVEGEATGGCSDAGFAASLGVPTLCGLGPVGGRAHTDAEYVERASILPRAQALALTILRFPVDPADLGSQAPTTNPQTAF